MSAMKTSAYRLGALNDVRALAIYTRAVGLNFSQHLSFHLNGSSNDNDNYGRYRTSRRSQEPQEEGSSEAQEASRAP